MPDDRTLETESGEQEEQPEQGPRLKELEFPEGYVPGRYAPWMCSPEPIYGPDELGEYKTGVEQMTQNVNKCDAAARIWEVLQAWEMRLFRRNYHFLTAGWKGWGMFGGSSGTSGASILQTQNAMKLFSCNVFGARHKKITALLSRQVPGATVAPVDDSDPQDQAAAEEGTKYLDVFIHQANLKDVVTKMAGYFCTDGRVGLLTYTVADQTRWGTELPERTPGAYEGEAESQGVSPETELQGTGNRKQATEEENEADEQPARREVTFVAGKLEWKVPLMADEEEEMGWCRYQHETGMNRLKAKYPWIRDKIATQGNAGGMDQIDRMARINVRLAVQASSSSGEAYKNDATESVTFFKPAEYETIADDDMRKVYYDTFPDGLEVWHAGGQLAFVRNARMSAHVKIAHPAPGDGQNREALLTNYLPLQKVLNAEISLADRYFRGAVARRFAVEGPIDTQQINSQSNDPAKITPVSLEGLPLGTKVSDLTGVESVPQPNTALFEFIQWLILGGPEAMDGGPAAAFGAADTEQGQGVWRTTRLKRDQALQVFSMPWAAECQAVCAIAQQAIESAAKNRLTDISASLPGQEKLKIELGKLQGSVLVQPESLEIPQTLAEEEEQMAALIEQSAQVAFYQQILTDPRNLSVFSRFPTLNNLKIPGADQVEQQQGEFEILMASGPVANPQLAAIQDQIQKGAPEIEQMTAAVAQAQASGDPQALQAAQQALQQHQAALQQLQQMAQTLPPMVSTVAPAKDTSENHTIHAAITLGMLTSPTGRKLKYGDDEQKQRWQNLKLHFDEHMTILKALQPPPTVEMKGTVTVDPSKLPPAAQAKAFQALGLAVSPDELQPVEQEHEVTRETEGVDAEGVPVKQKVSVVGKPLG